MSEFESNDSLGAATGHKGYSRLARQWTAAGSEFTAQSDEMSDPRVAYKDKTKEEILERFYLAIKKFGGTHFLLVFDFPVFQL